MIKTNRKHDFFIFIYNFLDLLGKNIKNVVNSSLNTLSVVNNIVVMVFRIIVCIQIVSTEM